MTQYRAQAVRHAVLPTDHVSGVAQNARLMLRRRAPQPRTLRSPDQEYDFVEEPPRDFFCAVTLIPTRQDASLLACRERADRVRCARGPTWRPTQTRKVRELRVRCPYTAGGCGWEGELGNRDAHTDSCLKKPWHCRYCSFSALREAAEEHTRGCERFPVACPNGCGVGQVHRYLLPQHLTEWPLQVVRCVYAHIGCSVQLPRSEMAAHTENSAQQGNGGERLREGGGGRTAGGGCSVERLCGRRPVCLPAQDGQSVVQCCMLDHSPGRLVGCS